MEIREIIKKWPSRRVFAFEVGVPKSHVDLWVHRDSIPAERDVAIIRAAVARSVPLTYEDLARMRVGV